MGLAMIIFTMNGFRDRSGPKTPGHSREPSHVQQVIRVLISSDGFGYYG